MAKGDPCALLPGPLKQACENTVNLAGGNSNLPSVTNPMSWTVGFGGDLAHFMVRVAEGIIGIMFVILGAAALAHASPSKVIKAGLK